MRTGGEFDFCALVYRALDVERVWVLISVADANHESACAELTIPPDWKRWTLQDDHEYLDAMLADFLEDCVSDPFGLLARISKLNAGLLVTAQAGRCDGKRLAQLKRSVLEPNRMGDA